MRMFKKEIWKILIRQRVLLWLLVFFIIKILSTFWGNESRPEYDTVEYRQYLEQYGGMLTYDAKQSFDHCYKEMRSVSEVINDLEDDFAQGVISENEYLEQMQRATQIKNKQPLTELFNDKIKYAEENPKIHYIIHNYGWEELLTVEKIDVLLIVFIFLIMVPMFCGEYESEMYYLHLCSRFGRNPLIATKIVAGMVLSIGMSIFSSLADYLYYWLNGGMEYGYAPVQSLSFFENSNLTCSLNQLWNKIVICRGVGAVYLTVMIFLISILLKRSLLCIVSNLVIVVVPMCFSKISNMKYWIPSPTGFLYATGYFYPNQYDYYIPDDIESFSEIEKYISFPEFTCVQRSIIFIAAFIIISAAMVLIFGGYKEKIRIMHGIQIYEKLKKINFFRSVGMVLLLSGIVVTMSGCVREQSTDDEEYACTMHVGDAKTDTYEFMVDGNNITAVEISSGKQFPVIRDVFEQLDNDTDTNLSIFTIKNYLFYSKVADDEWQIHKVDLKNFQDHCVYTQKVNNGLFCSYNLVLVSSDNYYVCDSRTLQTFYIDRSTGKWTTLGSIGSLTLGDYGNKMYYENDESKLVEYNFSDNTAKTYDEIVLPSRYSIRNNGATYFINDNYCYYINILDNNYIYKYDFDDGSNVLHSKDENIDDIKKLKVYG